MARIMIPNIPAVVPPCNNTTDRPSLLQNILLFYNASAGLCGDPPTSIPVTAPVAAAAAAVRANKREGRSYHPSITYQVPVIAYISLFLIFQKDRARRIKCHQAACRASRVSCTAPYVAFQEHPLVRTPPQQPRLLATCVIDGCCSLNGQIFSTLSPSVLPSKMMFLSQSVTTEFASLQSKESRRTLLVLLYLGKKNGVMRRQHIPGTYIYIYNIPGIYSIYKV